jgi:predicted dehydrogenase
MKQINYAVIGYGGIGKVHALSSHVANIKFDLPFKLNLKYVFSRKAEEDKIPGVKFTADYQEILDDETVDFVSVCTPNDFHFDFVKKAAEKGKHVYCEKPLSSNLGEAEAMKGLVGSNKVVGGVALNLRFLPCVQLLKRELSKKTIGDVIRFYVKTYHSSYLNPAKKEVWRTSKNSGGGAMLDLGIHLTDLVGYVFGDVTEVQGKTDIYFKDRTEVDEISKASILAGDIPGDLEVSRIFSEKEQSNCIEVYGTKGSIKVKFASDYEIEVFSYEDNLTKVIRSGGKGEKGLVYPAMRDSLGFFQNTHAASMVDFASKIYDATYVRTGADFYDACKAQEVVEKLYRQNS